MIGIGLLGAGRIGKVHARSIAAHPGAELLYVYDVQEVAAASLAKELNAKVAVDVEQVLKDSKVRAVLIASSTDTHVDLLTRAVTAGKAVLCEKPISLDMAMIKVCWQGIKDRHQRIQIGFNRRFDPNHRALRDAVYRGEIGSLEQLIITSRDPGLPQMDYLKVSGGIFRDMLIHDFDMARYILAEEPVAIQATGSALIAPELQAIGDVDTVMVTMKTASGKQCHINASRRAVYGYDQRIEALGSTGMLQSNNPLPTTLCRYDEGSTHGQVPLNNFFIERYNQAYQAQIDAFIQGLEEGNQVSPSFQDGYRAQAIAEAAQQAFITGSSVTIPR